MARLGVHAVGDDATDLGDATVQVAVEFRSILRGPLELVHSTWLERDGVKSQSMVPTLPMNEALRMETDVLTLNC